jgi:hypothetical protein
MRFSQQISQIEKIYSLCPSVLPLRNSGFRFFPLEQAL